MRLLHIFRNRPVLLLAVAGFGFVAWVVSDLVDTSPPPAPPPMGEIMMVQAPGVPPESRELPGPGVVTADVVPQLHPGMSRSAVEELIGPPPADLIHPVTEVDGRFTYRTTYLANLDPAAPNTVRPIPGRRPGSPVPRSLISLEFDASITGHPLLKVHYPDPLF